MMLFMKNKPKNAIQKKLLEMQKLLMENPDLQQPKK
jgi:hypothetical protein